MEGSTLLIEGLNNWKLRLILSALLCMMGLSALISLLLGLFLTLSIYDKTIVSIAICIVGIPTYLILSGLGKITPESIARFINENSTQVKEDLQILLKNGEELDEIDRSKQQKLISFFNETPLYKFLPDKPVKQAYFIMLISMIGSFSIWFFS